MRTAARFIKGDFAQIDREVISRRIPRRVLSSTRVNLYKLFMHHYTRDIIIILYLLFRTFRWKLSMKVDITIAPLNWISLGTRATSLVASPLRHMVFAQLLRRTYVSLYTEMLHLQARVLALRAYVPRLYHRRVGANSGASNVTARNCRTTPRSPRVYCL